jgi:hypothetical protein
LLLLYVVPAAATCVSHLSRALPALIMKGIMKGMIMTATGRQEAAN